MRPFITAVLALLAGLVLYFSTQLYKSRWLMRGLPQPPMPSKLLGHLPIGAECATFFPPTAHPQVYCYYIQQKYNMGKFFYVDMWPLGLRSLFIVDPDMASQYVTSANYMIPKADKYKEYLNKLLGENNMVGLDGPRWKPLRTMFNPGFASSHLMTNMVPYIVDASETFSSVLREKAKTGELFPFEEVAARCTIDIIGKVVLDTDLNEQKVSHPIVSTFRKQLALMPPPDTVSLEGVLSYFDFVSPVRLWLNGKKLDRLIGAELDKRFASQNSTSSATTATTEKKPFKNRSRSVVDLALEMYRQTTATAGGKGSSTSTSIGHGTMDKKFRQNAIDQFKTFIFAGHDTTASTLSYIFYLLHMHPEARARVVAELDQVFGPDRSATTAAAAIKKDPYIISKLEYCNCIMKETLRLFPPASTLRDHAPTSATITDPDTGKAYPLANFTVWPVAHAVQRQQPDFPSPASFIPERFLPASDPRNPFPNVEIRKDAWRAFEKGPRACIGQELAVIEIKIIMALTLRQFDFMAEYPELPAGREKEWEVDGHRAFQILMGAAKPYLGMPGRIELR